MNQTNMMKIKGIIRSDQMINKQIDQMEQDIQRISNLYNG